MLLIFNFINYYNYKYITINIIVPIVYEHLCIIVPSSYLINFLD